MVGLLLFCFLLGRFKRYADKADTSSAVAVNPVELFAIQDAKRWQHLVTFDPNEADETTLRHLGFSPTNAKAIVEYRADHPFENRWQMLKVPGIHYQQFLLFKDSVLIRRKAGASHFRLKGKLAPFDPNALSLAQFEALGFSPKAASTIIRFREAIGQFQDKQTFARCHAVDSATFALLAPYIQLPERGRGHRNWAAKQKSQPNFRLKGKLAPFDPNALSLAQFEALGFSPKAANTIIRFREAIGQFQDKQTFARCHAVDSATFALLAPYIQLPERGRGHGNWAAKQKSQPNFRLKGKLAPFDPNALSRAQFEALGFSPKAASTIIRFREAIGQFQDKQTFARCHAVDSATFALLAPYIQLPE